MPESQVTLTIISPAGRRQVALGGESLTVGRTDASALSIPEDGGLSRRHATLRREGDSVLVVDEGSTNGTFVNGQRVAEGGAVVNDGGEIRLGNSTTVAVSIKRDVEGAGAPSASVAAPSQSTPLPVVAAAAAVALLVLGVAGVGLYMLTRTDGARPMTATRKSSDPATPAASDSQIPESKSVMTPTPAPDIVTATGTPAAAPTAAVSILSSDFSQPVPDAETTAPPTGHRLYREMSEAEQNEFIRRRAQHVAMMMGRRPYAFTPDALKHIKFWLDAYARRAGNKRTGLWGGDTLFILGRARQNAPVIIRAFREHNVPVVVGLYIPFIETEYTNIQSNNAAGAAGLFQFLGPTAEHYGVLSAERTNVPKMAGAAAGYFRDNILSFGDDPMSVALSIAGYNRAPESVKRDLRNVLSAPSNEDKERSFWTLVANQGKLDEYFQRENVNYVPRFFAAAIVGETPWAFGADMRPLSTYTEAMAETAVATPAPVTH
jgi:pSer/pThr/pTyr-binding forkhead associated (FHA) protein